MLKGHAWVKASPSGLPARKRLCVLTDNSFLLYKDHELQQLKGSFKVRGGGREGVRVGRGVVGGESLVMTGEVVWTKRGRYAKVHARGEVEGQLALEGELMFSVIDD